MKTAATLKTKLTLLLAVTLWASAFAGIRAGLHGYQPGSLGLLRFLIASVCIFVMYLYSPKKSLMTWGNRILLLLAGMLGLGCYTISLNYGELSVPSGIASFIINLSPLVTLIFALFFLGESITLNMMIGTLISILGVALIMLSKVNQFNFQIGCYYVLIAMFISGIYSVMQKPFLKKYHALEVTAYFIWGATLLLLIYTPQMLIDMKTAPLSATLAVVYLGIFPATLGYLAWSYGLKEVPASQAANYLYFIPIVATLLGWIWLGEIPGWLSLLGGFIALLGVWIVNHPKAIKVFLRR